MKILNFTQNTLIGISLFILSYLPLLYAFGDISVENFFYSISFIAVFLVMLIRPLADIFVNSKILRKLVILRKGLGILSASIIVGFAIGKIIVPHSTYILSIFTAKYWSLEEYSLFAHLGEITGFILLITSNKLSISLLKQNWKRMQKLAYIFFYSGGIYKAFVLDSEFAVYAMLLITFVTITAFILNKKRIASQPYMAI